MSAENQQPKEQKRGPGWPPTRDQSVFDPLNGPVEQLGAGGALDATVQAGSEGTYMAHF